jgi:hypothetical protein
MDEALGRGRVLLFASDLGRQWNDFPLHAAFVPFVQETLGYVADTPATRREYLVGEVPPGVAPRPGIAKLADGSGPERLVAVNVEPSESDAGRLAADDFQRAIVRQNAEGASSPAAQPLSRREERQRLWQYALAAVLVLLTAEALVGARAA